jgi:hypothetical protein
MLLNGDASAASLEGRTKYKISDQSMLAVSAGSIRSA